MDKYLKMTDMFCGIEATRRGNELVCGEVLFAKFVDGDECEYAAHAINSHDELVAENERLRTALECATNHLPGGAEMVPDGWQLVPVEPTEAMISSVIDAGTFDEDDVAYFWDSMLAFAPTHEGGAS